MHLYDQIYGIVHSNGFHDMQEILSNESVRNSFYCSLLVLHWNALKFRGKFIVFRSTVLCYLAPHNGTTSVPLFPFVCMEQLGFDWKVTQEIWHIYFSKICRESYALKSDKNNGYFTWRPINFLHLISFVYCWMRIISDKVIEKIKTFYIQQLFCENCAGFVKICKNIV